jgi:hypothetical protein
MTCLWYPKEPFGFKDKGKPGKSSIDSFVLKFKINAICVVPLLDTLSPPSDLAANLQFTGNVFRGNVFRGLQNSRSKPS